jgi:hypothetical protein
MKNDRREKMINYYQMGQDNSLAGRWMIDHPSITENDEDTWFVLKLGNRLEGCRTATIEISEPGTQMDVSNTSMGNMILSPRAAAILETLAPGEVQYVDAVIDDRHCGYKALNILDHVDCLDPTLSVMLDPYPDGRPHVLKVAVNSKAAGSRNIFRVATWPVAIVITRRVKDRFDEEGITGAMYYPLASS